MIVWGTGTPLRQFLYVNDLAELLLPILDTFDGGQMILCGPEEVAINAVAEQIRRTVGYKGPIVNDVTKSDGLFRKTVTSEHVLAKVFPDFVFTPLEHGIAQTYDWYRTTLPRGRVTGNLPGCRGLAGGLGNQFYLIAATLATGWKNNLTPFFRYDGSLHYRYNNDHRTGVLGMLEFDHATDLAAYQHTTDTDAECPGDTVVEGYFQDPRHFAGFEDRVFEVLRSHTPPPEVDDIVTGLRTRYAGRPVVSVQVRRGDYLVLNWHAPLEYYVAAMRHVRDQHPTVAFVVSTDDRRWCSRLVTKKERISW